MSAFAYMMLLVTTKCRFLQAAYCLSAVASGAKVSQRAKLKQDCPLNLPVLSQLLDNVMRLGGVLSRVRNRLKLC